MSSEITMEEALDALVDDEEEIVTEADQGLPRLILGVSNTKEVSKFWGLSSTEKAERYPKWRVDEVLTDLRSAVGSWAEENGYEIDHDTVEAFDEPIDEQLLANLEGEIYTGDKKIDFGFYGGRGIGNIRTDPDTTTYDSAKTIQVYYDNFDGSMTDEYRELDAITEAVLSKYGDIFQTSI